jgi:alkylhydroperoxidase/carboxymuconolactone decarboxylase family protein YurZ
VERGREIGRRVFGDAVIEKRATTEGPSSREFREYGDLCMGMVWDRPTLNMRLRRFITMSMLIAQNRLDPLAIHMEAALNDGCTAEELKELVIHTSMYCGFPAAVEMNRIAEKLLKAHAKIGQHSPGG